SYGARGDKRAGMRERLALATDSHCGDGKQAREAEPASLRRHRRSRFGAIVDRLSVRHRANGGETPSHRRPQAGLESFRKLAACPSADGLATLSSMFRREYSIGSRAVTLSPFTLLGAGSSHVILSPIRFAQGKLFDCHSERSEESLLSRSG